MKIISLSDNEVLSEKAKTSERYILRGLPEVGIGTLLAGQDMGKSRLMYSIAYSLATNIDLVGLLPDDEKESKEFFKAITNDQMRYVKFFKEMVKKSQK